EDEEQDQHAESDEVEPLVRAQRETERRAGLRQHDALRAARPVLEILQDLWYGEGEREGREREVESLEAERRNSEEKAGGEAEEPRDWDRPAVRHAPPVDHDRGRVGAERVEGAVAERDLAVEARQDVEAEQRDRVDEDLGELEQAEVAQQERQRAGDRDRRENDRPPPPLPAAHTRCIATRPNSPLGLTSKTTRIIASATVSLSSVPMNFTYVPTRFSITPTRSPPSTAPPGLVKPPSVAEAKA